MQKSPARLDRTLIDNLIWLTGSLILAFFVWMIATLQSDPIQQQAFPEFITVRLQPDDGLLVVSPNSNERQVRVIVRAPRSVLSLLSKNEIEVWADLSGLGVGEHTVELTYLLNRQQASIVDISPSRVRVVLEESAQKQVPLRAVISSEPPPGYAHDTPTFSLDLNQVLVSGASSQVNAVVAAQVELNLRDQRSSLDLDLRLVAVNAQGQTITNVTLEPQTVRTSVNIRRRDDVREVTVRPTIDGIPPEGYVLSTLSYAPQTVLVSGSASQLAGLPATLSTEAIDLTNRTASFEVAVPVVLPVSGLLLLADQDVTVTVEINPVIGNRQFDAVPVELTGLGDGFTAVLLPETVSALVTGPQPEIDQLVTEMVQITLDLSGLVPGSYTLTPNVTIGQIAPENISLLPAEIEVEISERSGE
jgi:YbbR domain-containing protein